MQFLRVISSHLQEQSTWKLPMRMEISFLENSIMAHRTRNNGFAATGHTETGKWKDGLSPKEYEIKLKAETKAGWMHNGKPERRDNKRNKQGSKARPRETETTKEEQRKKSLIQKYGQRYGSLSYQGKLELSMTQQMCQEVIDIKSYDIGKTCDPGIGLKHGLSIRTNKTCKSPQR